MSHSRSLFDRASQRKRYFTMKEADVLIVGGGPVGLTLAAEMSYRGMSAILVEKRKTTSNSPKAVLVNSRSMEHYRRLGLQVCTNKDHTAKCSKSIYSKCALPSLSQEFTTIANVCRIQHKVPVLNLAPLFSACI